MRSYFYWEKHCYDIPVCFALQITLRRNRRHRPAHRKIRRPLRELGQAGCGPAATGDADPAPDRQPGEQPGADAVELRHQLRDQRPDAGANTDTATALGQAFDAAKNDDSFYLPPEAFANPDFKRGLKLFLSPDGKAARMIITHEGDPATPAGHLPHRPDQERRARGREEHPLGGRRAFYLAGTAATYKDIQDMAQIRPHDRRASPR